MAMATKTSPWPSALKHRVDLMGDGAGNFATRQTSVVALMLLVLLP